MGYIVYIAFVLLAVGLVIGEQLIKNDKIRLVLFLSLLLAFTFLGILKSNSVGTDSAGYSETYLKARSSSLSEVIRSKKPEFGFYGTMYIFSHILKLPEIVFNAFNFLIIAACLYLSLHKYERKTFVLAIFLFFGFFCMSFSGIRQAVGISIATLAFTIYFKENEVLSLPTRLIAYYFLCGMAILFHRTAVILLVLPLLFSFDIQEHAIPFIPLLMLLFFPTLIGRLTIVIPAFFEKVSYTPSDSRVSLIFIAEVVFLCIVFFIYETSVGEKIRKKLSISDLKFNSKDSKFVWLIYVGCLFMCFNTSSQIITRFSMYFYLGIVYLINRVMDTVEKPRLKFALIVGATLFLGLYFVYSTPELGLVPYAFR